MNYEEYVEEVKWYILLTHKKSSAEEKRIAAAMRHFETSVRRHFESGSTVCAASRALDSVI